MNAGCDTFYVSQPLFSKHRSYPLTTFKVNDNKALDAAFQAPPPYTYDCVQIEKRVSLNSQETALKILSLIDRSPYCLSLSLSGLSIAPEKAFEDLLRSPQIRHIDLSNTKISLASLEKMQYFPSQFLTIVAAWQPGIYHEPMSSWVLRQQNLRILDLTGLTQLQDETLEKISFACPKITALSVAQCQSLTRASLLSISRLKHLESLKLDHFQDLPPDFFSHIPKKCHHLTDLSLKNAVSIYSSILISLYTHTINLRFLNIEGHHCERHSLPLFWSRWRNLQGLDLSNSAHLTSKCLRTLSRYCPSLRQLFLHRCNLQDPHLRSLVFLKELSLLDLSYNKGLSTEGLIKLIATLPKLEKLVLIGLKSKSTLQRQYPHLQISFSEKKE